MKIIHCADIHIESVFKNLPNDKAKLRKREVIDTFINMLDYAEKNKVSVIIIAGDFFDKNNIASSVKKEVLDAIALHSKIDILYLAGNHDNRLELNDLPNNFKRFDNLDDFKYFVYGGVTVAGIDISKQKDSSFYEKLTLPKSGFNIVVLHGEHSAIQWELLKSKNIDFVALGDAHTADIKPNKLDRRAKYGYSGCLEGHGFDECGEKGFFVMEITDNILVNHEFVSIAKRKYDIVSVDITDCDTHTKIVAAVKKKLKGIDVNNLIRVELVGKYKASTQKEIDTLLVKLKEEFFFAQVKDKSILDIDEIIDENDISLKSEFIRVVRKSGLNNEQIDRVIEYGFKALAGEVIEV